MRLTKVNKLAILLATLFLLMSAAVFASTYMAGNDGKVIPPGWCRIHGEVDQMLLSDRLVCIICNN